MFVVLSGLCCLLALTLWQVHRIIKRRGVGSARRRRMRHRAARHQLRDLVFSPRR